MTKEQSFLLLFIIFFTFSYSQNSKKRLMHVTDEELSMTTYEKDTEAEAVVLYEEGKNYFVFKDRHIIVVKKYYQRIKILKSEGVRHATISIPYHHNGALREEVHGIKGITHNGKQHMFLSDKDIYQNDIGQYWSEYRFALPNVKKGSVITYEYSIESPFLFNLNGWDFQSDIPKIKSVYNAEIPGNYVYNRKLMGFQKLSVNEAEVKGNCFDFPGYVNPVDCEVLRYEMEDIPAFKKEDYMLSEMNYLSRIKFELSEYYGYKGSKQKYTKSWKDVDREFKNDKDIGRQYKKVSFFEEQLPDHIKNESDPLKKSKAVYQFIQKHFTWNEKYGIFRSANVKKAFDEKVGNVAEINISLINALKAAGLDAELVLLSTRNTSLPTTDYPVISDFNYIIAKLNLENETILLDATDKFAPFRILPRRALNYLGRSMDFKNSSNWIDLHPYKKNGQLVNALLTMDETGEISGNVSVLHKGYDYYDILKKMGRASSREDYITTQEQEHEIEINSYKIKEEDISLKETFEVLSDNTEALSDNTIIFNPFIINDLKENPFKLKERSYPVDFAHPKLFQYRVSVKLPDTYEIINPPKEEKVILPNGGGILIYNVSKTTDGFQLSYRFQIKRTIFNSDEYEALKSFFAKAIKIHNNQPITIKKIVN